MKTRRPSPTARAKTNSLIISLWVANKPPLRRLILRSAAKRGSIVGSERNVVVEVVDTLLRGAAGRLRCAATTAAATAAFAPAAARCATRSGTGKVDIA